MTEKEELQLEIKQLKQSMSIMRSIIDKQQQKLMFFDRLLFDWMQDQKEQLKNISPNYE